VGVPAGALARWQEQLDCLNSRGNSPSALAAQPAEIVEDDGGLSSPIVILSSQERQRLLDVRCTAPAEGIAPSPGSKGMAHRDRQVYVLAHSAR
jgi:hypothetical protein